MNEKVKDFFRFLLFFAVNLGVSGGVLFLNSVISGSYVSFGVSGTILLVNSIIYSGVIVLLLLCLKLKAVFQYEATTYFTLVASVMLSVLLIVDIDKDFLPGIFGVPLFCIACYSRIYLWKYDSAVKALKEEK